VGPVRRYAHRHRAAVLRCPAHAGLVLIVTAGNLLKPEGQDSHSADNIMIRAACTLFHTSGRYGRRVMTRCFW
jgi:hypothetical protein